MKYFEFKEPYYALIRADNEEKAIELYNFEIADLYEDELCLIKEIEEDIAFAKFLKAYTETDSISEMTLSFHNNDLLLVDGCLL